MLKIDFLKAREEMLLFEYFLAQSIVCKVLMEGIFDGIRWKKIHSESFKKCSIKN
jgi:hypothetical protein